MLRTHIEPEKPLRPHALLFKSAYSLNTDGHHNHICGNVIVHLRYVADNRDVCIVSEVTVTRVWVWLINWSTDWGLTALSAQIGYIVPLISMLQFKSEINKKVDKKNTQLDTTE